MGIFSFFAKKKTTNNTKCADNVSETKESIIAALAESSKNHDSRNFIMSFNSGLTACYVLNHFYITDDNFNVIYEFTTLSEIVSCSISDNGEYAAFQTAYDSSKDSNCLFFVDILNKNVRKRLMGIPTNEKTRIYIDTHKRIIFINCIGTTTKFNVNFDGDIILCDIDNEALKLSLKGKSDEERAIIWGTTLEKYLEAKNGLIEYLERPKDPQPVIEDDVEWEKELDAKNKARSAEFQDIHEAELNKIDVEALESIKLIEPKPLGAKTLLFLGYIQKKTVVNPNIPGYWTHTFHFDFNKAVQILFSYGYLTFSDYYYNMQRKTIPELKQFLSSKDIKPKSRKLDIIFQIQHNFSQEELKAAFNDKYYVPTPAGEEVLTSSEYNCVNFFHTYHNDFDITMEEALDCKRAKLLDTNFEIVSEILSSRVTSPISASSFLSLEFIFHKLALAAKYENNTDIELKMKISEIYLHCREPLNSIGYENVAIVKSDLKALNISTDELKDMLSVCAEQLKDCVSEDRAEKVYQALCSALSKGD